ncbi:MAG: hypothetical protein Q7T82_17385 [Armatimonadota bacterium]|nr:hypothetical protein [Armatimonadota bacterium]
MLKHRFAITAILTIALTYACATFRPPSLCTGVPPDTLWLQKVHWRSRFDIVLAGCSRAVGGLSPSAMKEELPTARIGNFAFNGQTYTPDYLEALHGPLDPNSRRKAVVMSVQPLNFFRSVHEKSGYRLCRQQNLLGQWLMLNLGEVVYSLRPFKYKDAQRLITGDRNGFYQDYHADGWVCGRLVPEDPSFQMTQYDLDSMREKVSPEIVKGFMDAVRSFRKQNTAVFVIRLPTNKTTLAQEDASSGFDEQSFRAQVEAAGGEWIDVPDKTYRCFDGSHLNRDSAMEVSRMVAKAIRRQAESAQKPPRAGS